MSSSDFFSRLERQLVEAAERDVAVSPGRRRLSGLADRFRPRRLVLALPVAAAALVVGAVVAVVLSLGGEQPPSAAGGGAPPASTSPTSSAGLTVEPLGTAPPTGTAIPIPPAPGGGYAPGKQVPPVPYGARPIPIGPSVFLLNGTGTDGLAARLAKRLEQLDVPVAGTGDIGAGRASVSVVYTDGSTSATPVAQKLGIVRRSSPIPRDLRQITQGADVVVLLAADIADRRDRQVKLTGKAGAAGVVLLAKDGGLSFVTDGLPPSNRYFLWGENAAGDDVPIGFAAYDKRKRQAAGSIPLLPPTLALDPARRIFLTLEKTKRPKTPGEIVLDSGRIPG